MTTYIVLEFPTGVIVAQHRRDEDGSHIVSIGDYAGHLTFRSEDGVNYRVFGEGRPDSFTVDKPDWTGDSISYTEDNETYPVPIKSVHELGDLIASLTSLKENAKPKTWIEIPQDWDNQFGYLFSACIENGIFILGISRDPDMTFPIIDIGELITIIVKLYGECSIVYDTSFKIRGKTTLLGWDLKP